MISFRVLEDNVDDLRKQYNRLLELCMYALIRDTKIYNRELDDVTKLRLIECVRKNMYDDTFTLRNKLIEVFESKED